MGIFDRLRKPQSSKQPLQRQKDFYSMAIQDSEEIEVFNIEKIKSIKHRNGELTDLMMARILKQNPMETIFVDLADYITFEIPKGMEINDEIIQTVMIQYQQQQRGNINQQQYYIGRLIDERNELVFGNKSVAVEGISSQEIQKRIQQKREQVERSMQESKQREISERDRLLEDINARGYLKECEEEINRRRENPTLKRAHDFFQRQDSKKYYNYDGVNLNTGDVLRIRKLDKVGKDGSGTYLYSAYIYNTQNEDDIEWTGEEPKGVAICFEMQKRIEDVVNNGNIDEIRQVLQLLSDERNFENPNQLSYIGEIDKEGHANRRTMSTSSAIQSTIRKMQRQFAEKIEQQQGIQEQ